MTYYQTNASRACSNSREDVAGSILYYNSVHRSYSRDRRELRNLWRLLAAYQICPAAAAAAVAGCEGASRHACRGRIVYVVQYSSELADNARHVSPLIIGECGPRSRPPPAAATTTPPQLGKSLKEPGIYSTFYHTKADVRSE